MANGQLPEEVRDRTVEQLMREVFQPAAPIDEEPERASYQKPTLFIGCGGTGKGIVREVRRRVRALYPDSALYQFLVFDTDPRDSDEFEASEFQYLGGFEPMRVIMPTMPDPVRQWWQPGFRPAGGIIDDGARTIRMLGRLSLFQRINEVEQAITIALTNALNFFKNRLEVPPGPVTVHVYIVSSISGGTGSGIYLDIAYLARALCEQLGVQSHFVGVLGLPNIFENTLSLNAAEREAIEANSYAALEELDHFMDSQSFRCDYGTRRVRLNVPPFNMIYLFGAINEQGLALNKREIIFSMVGEALQVEAASSISQAHEGDYAFAAGRWNLIKGSRAFYSSFAAASVAFPAELVVRYCGLKLAIEMLDALSISNRNADNSEAQAFVDTNTINEDGPGNNQVQDFLIQDERGERLSITVNYDELVQRVPADQNVSGHIRQCVQDYENTFADIQKSIKRQSAMLLQRTREALEKNIAEYAADAGKGPGYAVSFLDGLRSLLTSYSQQMENEAHQLSVDLQHHFPPTVAQHVGGGVPREELWARMVESAAQTRLWRRRRIANALRHITGDMNRYYATRLQLTLLQHSKAFFDTLVGDIDRLRSNMDGLMRQLRNLKDMMIGIRTEHVARLRTLSTAQTTALSVVDFEAVERLYRAHKPSDVNVLLQQVLGEIDFTGETDIRATASEVLGLAVRHFKRLENSSLTDIARQAYGDAWQQKLSEMIDGLIERALHPFWNYEAEYAGAEDHLRNSYYVALPAGDQFLSDLFARRAHKPQQIPTNNPRSIVMLHLKHNIPLFALTMLPRLFATYEELLHPLLRESERIEAGDKNTADHIPLHLHKDWHSFGDVVPPQQEAMRREAFEIAVAYGIIRQQPNRGFFLARGGGRKPIQLGDTRRDALSRFVTRGDWVALTNEKINDYERGKPALQLQNTLRKQMETIQSRIRELEALEARGRLTPDERDELEQIRLSVDTLREYLSELRQSSDEDTMGRGRERKSAGARSTRGQRNRRPRGE